MADKEWENVEGYISKRIPGKNPDWYAFVLQRDETERLYSTFLGGKFVKPDFADAIKSLDTGVHVQFVIEEQPTDGKTFYNIKQVEIIRDVHDDLKEEPSGNGGQPTYSDKDKQIARSVALKIVDSWASLLDTAIDEEEIFAKANRYAHFVLTGE